MSAPAPSLAPEIHGYLENWARGFAEAAAVPSSATCEVLSEVPADAPAPADTDLWMTVKSATHVEGEIVLRMDRLSALRLAQSPTADNPEGAVQLSAEEKDAVLQGVRHAALSVAKHMQPPPGVEGQVEFSAAPSEPSAPTFWLKMKTAGAHAIVLELRLDDALLRALQSSKGAPVRPQAAAEKSPAESLDMLMEVELAAALRFGERQMPLKEILDLSAGSVVVLDQQVQDPVVLLLDGKPVARGEVLIVNGNFGLRVTEILSGKNDNRRGFDD